MLYYIILHYIILRVDQRGINYIQTNIRFSIRFSNRII
jgi:hypothetical protein